MPLHKVAIAVAMLASFSISLESTKVAMNKSTDDVFVSGHFDITAVCYNAFLIDMPYYYVNNKIDSYGTYLP